MRKPQALKNNPSLNKAIRIIFIISLFIIFFVSFAFQIFKEDSQSYFFQKGDNLIFEEKDIEEGFSYQDALLQMNQRCDSLNSKGIKVEKADLIIQSTVDVITEKGYEASTVFFQVIVITFLMFLVVHPNGNGKKKDKCG